MIHGAPLQDAYHQWRVSPDACYSQHNNQLAVGTTGTGNLMENPVYMMFQFPCSPLYYITVPIRYWLALGDMRQTITREELMHATIPAEL
jgi:hypothetical protein